jgi:polar amino acid transport system permease protein/octopine/nopaline transport system permease protein/arginine/ornithine transport system permease protein
MIDLHGYGWMLMDGLKVTLLVGVTSLVIAIVFGLIAAWGKLSSSRAAQRIAETYTIVIRGVPELVLILLIYYGSSTAFLRISEALGAKTRLDLDPFTSGVITLGFIYGAFTTEVFRGAYLAVPVGQIEAAKSAGMGTILRLRRIILPQMMRYALPGLGNVWMVLIKATALMSAIQAEELLRKARIAAGATREPFTFYFAVLLIFLAITLVSMQVIRYLEAWAERGVRRA